MRDKVKATLDRNGLESVQCITSDRGIKLTGTVTSQADKAIAFALARTTVGADKLSNQIKVVSPHSDEPLPPDVPGA